MLLVKNKKILILILILKIILKNNKINSKKLD